MINILNEPELIAFTQLNPFTYSIEHQYIIKMIK